MDSNKLCQMVREMTRTGSVLGLQSIKTLLGKIGNPEKSLNIIHVAGTNGKGSTIAFLSHILVEAGYKVGKYTSPVVFHETEMYQINNENITEEDKINLTASIYEAMKLMKEEGADMPTAFEVDTACAFKYFNDNNCDIAIIETGMGGDMDATNVCDKVLVSVITSISLDHTGILGETLAEIAAHKAGIIKAECPVVAYNQSDEVLKVIKAYGRRVNAPVYISGVAFRCDEEMLDIDVSIIDIGLKGAWQKDNALVAVKVIEVLNKKGYNISKVNVIDGLSKTKLSGRFEELGDIIFDGGHNPGAAKRLRETIDSSYKDYPFIYVMGMYKDKDFENVVRIMADRAEYIYTVGTKGDRELTAKDLSVAVRKYNKNVDNCLNYKDAIERALDMQGDIGGNCKVLVFGSLSILGEMRSCYNDIVRGKQSE